MSEKLGARYATSNINFSNTNDQLVSKLCRSHAKASTSHLMKLERDSALSFLKQFVKNGGRKSKDEKVLNSVQLFRLFISYRETEVKKEFFKSEVVDVIHQVLLIYMEKSQDLDKQNLLADRQKGVTNYCFKLNGKTCHNPQQRIKQVEAQLPTGVTKFLETCENDLIVQVVDQVLIECCWFFTNVLIVEDSEVVSCIRKGIHQTLIKVLSSSQNVSVKLHCFWSLRNMSASNLEVAESIIKENVFDLVVNQLNLFKEANIPLIDIVCTEYSSGLQSTYENTVLKMFEQMVELVRNITSYKTGITMEVVKKLIPLVKFFTTSCKNTILLQNSCILMAMLLECFTNDALTYKGDVNSTEDDLKNTFCERKIVLGENVKVIDIFFEENLLRLPLVLLLHKHIDVVNGSLRLIGNVLLGSFEQIEKLVQMGVIKNLLELTKSPNNTIRKEACWCLSNCATTFENTLDFLLPCQVYIDSDMFKKTFNLDVVAVDAKMSAVLWMGHLFAKDRFASIRYELAWFFSNLAQTGGKRALDVIHSSRVYILFCRFLETFVEVSSKSPVLIMDISETLGNIAKDYEMSSVDLMDLKVTIARTLSLVLSWPKVPKDLSKLLKAQTLIHQKKLN